MKIFGYIHLSLIIEYNPCPSCLCSTFTWHPADHQNTPCNFRIHWQKYSTSIDFISIACKQKTNSRCLLYKNRVSEPDISETIPQQNLMLKMLCIVRYLWGLSNKGTPCSNMCKSRRVHITSNYHVITLHTKARRIKGHRTPVYFIVFMWFIVPCE